MKKPSSPLLSLFQDFQAGRVSPARFRKALQAAEAGELPTPGAILDPGRERRAGFPEAIYGAGKTPAQVVRIFRALLDATGKALATRCPPATLRALRQAVPRLEVHEGAGLAWRVTTPTPPSPASRRHAGTPGAQSPAVGGPDAAGPRAAVLAAGTSDLPVAEEAALTLEFAGFPVDRFFDIGVAGIHRLFGRLEAIRRADVVIAVAGMEGALPSVVGGLVAAPLIAVPTSVGYGASFQGLAALLGMLNACSAGITVVNIDNGFGAAVAAVRILQGRNP
ncbi:MAG: nickel pincer cofactor biosynthesis protein LarB [Candidatus Riflebacteria bacterium]|nr:nickel pincer cofactor biosynthesis protein LarB [Candidatus Riflebacteria bacterium]